MGDTNSNARHDRGLALHKSLAHRLPFSFFFFFSFLFLQTRTINILMTCMLLLPKGWLCQDMSVQFA